MLKITDSLAPDTVTVKELAQVCRDNLLFHFATVVGLYATVDDPSEQVIHLSQVARDNNHNMAMDNFRSWAKDMNCFYNAEKTAEYLRDLFMAVESATSPLSPLYHLWTQIDGHGDLSIDAYYRDLAIMMEDGEFDSLLNSYNQVIADAGKAVDTTLASKQATMSTNH
jgi:hypothetical protein